MILASSSGSDPPAIVKVDPEQWVRNHGHDLFQHAICRVRAHDVAEDLVQETFLAAWEGRHQFEGRAAERTWLLRILDNKIADYYRNKARRISLENMEVLAEFEMTQFKSGLMGEKWARTAIPMSWHHVRESVEKEEFWETVRQCASK